MFKKAVACLIIVCFSTTMMQPLARAAGPAPTALSGPVPLPPPGTMVNLSPAYEPALIKGLTVHKDNPFLFDFIVDTGNDAGAISNRPYLKTESDRLVKYFFACLTIPEKDLWVNLSPYEKNKMIPPTLGQTALGRDLLAEDYILKQLTASLIYPEKDLGKEFWNKVYTKAQQIYGTNQIPVNTFNKVWILADKATVYEHGQAAFVVSGHLKVILEEDYLAMEKHQNGETSFVSRRSSQINTNDDSRKTNDTHAIASQIVRDLILPEIEKEVNTGKNFAMLRQIFNSLILASWYKKNLKEALLNQVYADRNKVKGLELRVKGGNGLDPLPDTLNVQAIYNRYLAAYKKGVFNYIKEDVGPDGQRVPRKYFSGGFGSQIDEAMVVSHDPAMAVSAVTPMGTDFSMQVAVNINGQPIQNPDAAMMSLQRLKTVAGIALATLVSMCGPGGCASSEKNVNPVHQVTSIDSWTALVKKEIQAWETFLKTDSTLNDQERPIFRHTLDDLNAILTSMDSPHLSLKEKNTLREQVTGLLMDMKKTLSTIMDLRSIQDLREQMEQDNKTLEKFLKDLQQRQPPKDAAMTVSQNQKRQFYQTLSRLSDADASHRSPLELMQDFLHIYNQRKSVKYAELENDPSYQAIYERLNLLTPEWNKIFVQGIIQELQSQSPVEGQNSKESDAAMTAEQVAQSFHLPYYGVGPYRRQEPPQSGKLVRVQNATAQLWVGTVRDLMQSNKEVDVQVFDYRKARVRDSFAVWIGKDGVMEEQYLKAEGADDAVLKHPNVLQIMDLVQNHPDEPLIFVTVGIGHYIIRANGFAINAEPAFPHSKGLRIIVGNSINPRTDNLLKQIPDVQKFISAEPDAAMTADLRTKTATRFVENARLLMPEHDYNMNDRHTPLDLSLIHKLIQRNSDQVRELLLAAKQKGIKLTIVGHLRGLDGAGSSLDLPEFQKSLTKQGETSLDALPSTVTIASEKEVKISFEAADDPNVVEYVAPFYGISADHPLIFSSDVQLTEHGRLPKGQRDAIGYIFRNIFGLKGVRITLEGMSTIAQAGGMESSNAFNIALLTAGSMLSGANLSYVDIVALAVKLENDEIGGLTGGQGHWSTILGGAQRLIWASGVKDGFGHFVNHYGVVAQETLSPQQLDKIEQHVMLVQAGKKYVNGNAAVDRTAGLTNNMWTDILRFDRQGQALHQEKVGLTSRYAKALAEGDFKTAVEVLNRYVDIRDAIARRWINLMMDAVEVQEGQRTRESVPEYAYAQEFARKVFNPQDEVEANDYKVIRDFYNQYKAAGKLEQLRQMSLYWQNLDLNTPQEADQTNSLIPDARKVGIGLFPLGAGGPGGIMMAVSSQGLSHLKSFFESKGLAEITEEKAYAIVHAPGENVLKGYLPFKVGKEPIRVEGFGQLADSIGHVVVPALPEKGLVRADSIRLADPSDIVMTVEAMPENLINQENKVESSISGPLQVVKNGSHWNVAVRQFPQGYGIFVNSWSETSPRVTIVARFFIPGINANNFQSIQAVVNDSSNGIYPAGKALVENPGDQLLMEFRETLQDSLSLARTQAQKRQLLTAAAQRRRADEAMTAAKPTMISYTELDIKPNQEFLFPQRDMEGVKVLAINSKGSVQIQWMAEGREYNIGWVKLVDLLSALNNPKSIPAIINLENSMSDSPDFASVTTKPGGIDLNAANMGLSVTKDANGGVQVNFDQGLIERIKQQGVQSVVPVIINVTPLTPAQIRPLLGMPAAKEEERLAGV